MSTEDYLKYWINWNAEMLKIPTEITGGGLKWKTEDFVRWKLSGKRIIRNSVAGRFTEDDVLQLSLIYFQFRLPRVLINGPTTLNVWIVPADSHRSKLIIFCVVSGYSKTNKFLITIEVWCSWNAHKIINTHSKKLWFELTCSSETAIKTRAVAWFIHIVVGRFNG